MPKLKKIHDEDCECTYCRNIHARMLIHNALDALESSIIALRSADKHLKNMDPVIADRTAKPPRKKIPRLLGSALLDVGLATSKALDYERKPVAFPGSESLK